MENYKRRCLKTKRLYDLKVTENKKITVTYYRKK